MTTKLRRRLARGLHLMLVALLVAFVLVPLSAVGEDTAPQAQAQTTPDLNEKCGSSVAFVIDLSNSLTYSDVDNVKKSIRSMVDGLAGAPYTVSLYTFATGAPAYGQTNVLEKNLLDPADVTALKTAINAVTLPGSVNNTYGGTNWEGGLQQVADDMANGHSYDAVYMITDGAPTFDNSGSNYAGNTTELVELQKAQTQAKRISELGAKLIPIGVGDAIYSNTSVPLRVRGFLRWYTNEYSTPQAMLQSLASTGVTPYIVQNYADLSSEFQENIARGCLYLVKNIVDGDGVVIDHGADWTFNLTSDTAGVTMPSSVTTNEQGSAELAIDKIGTDSVSLTITENPQSNYRLRQVNSYNATCYAFQIGGERRTLAISNVGDAGIKVAVSPTEVVSCEFNNVPEVSMQLAKRLDVKTPQLQEEINKTSYDFTYKCEYGSQTLAEGTKTGVSPTSVETLGSFPLGTLCTVTETTGNPNSTRMTMATSWEGTNFKQVSTRDDGKTVVFQATADAYLKGAPSTAQAVNTFDATTATFRLSKVIASGPDGAQNKSYGVTYSCRYIPDPNSPPESGATGGTNPYNVAEGSLLLRGDGTVSEVGPFPVGTQCAFYEQTLADGSGNPAIDGYDLNTTWDSTLCADKPGQSCQSNFMRLYEPGTFDVKVSNSYTRATTSLTITKAIDGEAKALGQDKTFTFDVVCKDGDAEVFSKKGISVVGADQATVIGVPVASTCTVSEQSYNILGVQTPAQLPAQTITIDRDEAKNTVTLLNTLDYHMVPLTVKKKVVNSTLLSDIELPSSFDVTATCTATGSADPVPTTVTVTADGSALVGDFPLGTECTLEENAVTPPEGATMSVSYSAKTIKLSDPAGAKVTVTNTFTPNSSTLTVSKNVSTDGLDAAVLARVPEEFSVSYSCEGVNGILTLNKDNGYTAAAADIPSGAACTLSEDDTTAAVDNLVLTKAWSASNGSAQADGSFIATMPIDGSGLSVNLTNTYVRKTVPLSVEKSVTLKDASGADVKAVWGTAYDLTGVDARKYQITYVCTADDAAKTEVARATLAFTDGETKVVEVPTGTTCEVFEGDAAVEDLGGPSIGFDGSSGGDVTADGTIYSIPVSQDSSGLKVTVNNGYTMYTGSFNIKKKVDGEGVATISAEREYQVSYQCTLNGTEVKKGSFDTIKRFDSAADYSVSGLPLGTDCTITEEPDIATVANATWQSRWTVAPGPSGWEAPEQPCANVGQCRSTGDHYQVKYRIAAVGTADGNNNYFQGTLVVWNTYLYDKAKVQVSKVLAGDGAQLASNDEFKFNLICTDPGYAELSQGHPYISDPTIKRTVTIKGGAAQTFDAEIPVGFSCTISEDAFPTYDANTTVSFDGATATEGGVREATFSVNPPESGSSAPQEVRVTNTYVRTRAPLTVDAAYTDRENAVNDKMLKSSFDVTWRCEDPVLGNFEGSATLDASNSYKTAIKVDGLDLPLGTLCTITQSIDGYIPDGKAATLDAPGVEESHSVTVTRTPDAEGETDTVVASQYSNEIAGVDVIASTSTNVSFRNVYWLETMVVSLSKYVEGDPDHEVFVEGQKFGFHYQCTMPKALDGTDSSEGTFALAAGESWTSDKMPVGSTCTVTEDDLDATTQEALDAKNLRLAINYVYPWGDLPEINDTGEDTDSGPALVIAPDTGDAPRVAMGDGGIRLGYSADATAGYYAYVFNSLYRTDAEVQIEKVDPDDQPLPGATFAVYPAAEDGTIGSEPVIAEVSGITPDSATDADSFTGFSMRLKPGTYYLVETRSGENSQLLPRPWQFEVKAVDGTDEASSLGDLKVELAGVTSNSGLIALQAPAPDDDSGVWIIKVANVEMGELPLTGGRGIWLGLGAGAGLLLAAVGYWLHRRRVA